MRLRTCLAAVLITGLAACSQTSNDAPGNTGSGGAPSTSSGGRGGGTAGNGGSNTGGSSPAAMGGSGGSASGGADATGGAGIGGAGGTMGTADGSPPETGGSTGTGGTTNDGSAPADAPPPLTGPFALTSPVVMANQVIAPKYRCGMPNVSPPLAWPAGPSGTMSYAVTMLHAASVHWTLWDIPATVTSLPENIAREAEPMTPAGSKQTKPNLDGATWFGYTGPCPQGAAQHYEFNVYALPVAKLDGVTTASAATAVNAAILKAKPLATAQLSVMASK
jgi:Raf kinase inhibitor-like YbhB/YbcL family protein